MIRNSYDTQKLFLKIKFAQLLIFENLTNQITTSKSVHIGVHGNYFRDQNNLGYFIELNILQVRLLSISVI